MKNSEFISVSEEYSNYLLVKEPVKNYEEHKPLNSSTAVAEFARNGWAADINVRERFKVLYVNNQNIVVGTYELSTGGINATLVDVRLVMATGLLCGAMSMILVHNHPSGNIKPSDADISITKDLEAAGKIMRIRVLDHVILTNDRHYSFMDEGRL